MKIVFDFGAVLFRWHPPSFLARVWSHRAPDEVQGAALAKELFQDYRGDWGAFDQGLIDASTTADRIHARTGWPREDIVAVMDAVPSELKLIEGSAALIQELKAHGHTLHFLSNMPEPYADYLEQTFPLKDWFVSGVFSGRVKQSKPSREIFDLALEQFGAKPDEVLFLDDHPDNIAAAKALGWHTHLFTTPELARQDLVRRGLLPA
ncbi:HAD family hydrolase [Roseateles chitinivorans]|uniref:HAD family hydrolase n=1 Tax=Roseateles chitinivorans TaxID=2917965 RepID=UPI003D67AE42